MCTRLASRSALTENIETVSPFFFCLVAGSQVGRTRKKPHCFFLVHSSSQYSRFLELRLELPLGVEGRDGCGVRKQTIEGVRGGGWWVAKAKQSNRTALKGRKTALPSQPPMLLPLMKMFGTCEGESVQVTKMGTEDWGWDGEGGAGRGPRLKTHR